MKSNTPSSFFEKPILNSPYECPSRHWKLDEKGQPTGRILSGRREAAFITPVPNPRRRQEELLDEKIGEDDQKYQKLAHIINGLRQQLRKWRDLPQAKWQVTAQTARLLKHWRSHKFQGFRPFFCQMEAAEAAIWLTEVAPKIGKTGRQFLEHLQAANNDANPGLPRLALKMATGAGKTTVMAMIIAWQAVNAARRPNSRRFTRGFLVVTPGITIKDRLRVLFPNDRDNYYKKRELVPGDMLGDIARAKIVITNYHAFMLREKMDLSQVGRALIQGRRGPELKTKETEGQMLRRVMPELTGMKNILAFNDEGHHCYRERPLDESEEGNLTGDARKEAEKNQEAARVWISGLEAVQRKLGLNRIFDLSATPFFLRGSGYKEGTLFPWTMSDFSLWDAIECGIVKLPRVPVSDNIPGADMPQYRALWENIRGEMPKKGRGKAAELDPIKLPEKLQTALAALYGHYEKVFDQWRQAENVEVPPCFIIVCNNTATSKLVYDYIAGFQRGEPDEDGRIPLEHGRLPLFRNFHDDGTPLPRPNTLLIDSEQLESGEALDKNFRAIAADEIERFRQEIQARTGNRRHAEKISDQDLLREVMNTVGKPGTLGAQIRCVVSVSMLTEGWDANNVTHILGVRAFGTQLLCEQVVGRALRRQSYELNENDLFNVEYADVLGVPFDFTAKPDETERKPPKPIVHVRAVRPDRDHLEIRFPRVEGYRAELPAERLSATFNDDSSLTLTPDLVGATKTRNEGIIGKGVDLTVEHLRSRSTTVTYHLAHYLLETKWRDGFGHPKLYLYGQLKHITKQWRDGHLHCKGGAKPSQLLYRQLADKACERIHAGIVSRHVGDYPIQAILSPYNPAGSTAHVHFSTIKKTYKTDPRRCPINYAVCDSDWEAEFCRVVESHPQVCSYVKNQGLDFTVPYRSGSESRRYFPDFIVLINDRDDEDDLLHLVVEIKGYRREDGKEKKNTMETYWIPGVNWRGDYGRWEFAELTDGDDIEKTFASVVKKLTQ